MAQPGPVASCADALDERRLSSEQRKCRKNFASRNYDTDDPTTTLSGFPSKPAHVGGLLDASGASAFPNAEIKVPAPEAAFWMDDGNMSRAQGPLLAGFKNNRRVMDAVSKQVTRYEWNKEVAAGITSTGTPGHTPGHTSFVVASGNSKILVQSDVTNNPYLFLRNPGWHVMYDMDGPRAEETRRRFYDMAAVEKALIAGFHFPIPSLGYVEKDGPSNYRLVPIAWQPTI